MSKLLQTNGDDHPEAAVKHLDDATALLAAGRHDGAAYLAGYVVECSLKTVILLDQGKATWTPGGGHDLNTLGAEALRFASLPTARTAKYMPVRTPSHPLYTGAGAWGVGLRYRAPGTIAVTTAQTWLDEARRVFSLTVVPMRLDGVI